MANLNRWRRGARIASILMPAMLVTAAGAVGCNKAPPAKEGKNPRVIVSTPVADTVMDYQDFTGRLEAVKSIDIRARVTGYVTEIPFKEGDFVKEGQLLFQIDRRPYEADLNLAQANLNVSFAERNLQEKNAERMRKILPTKTITVEEFETVEATYLKSVASVAAMEAAKEKAKLYLDYTKVTAPVSGRISRRFVDPGNLIVADNTILTTIVTENPVYAYFDVDERTYLDLLSGLGLGKDSRIEELKLPLMIRLANEKFEIALPKETESERIGEVDFVDNRVVATTGTVRMRGVFKNTREKFKPGLFVRIRLPIGKAYRALLIPDEAIQSDQERKYVWVVNAQNVVEYRSVEVGQSLQKLRVLRPAEKGKEKKEGLSEGERVIVNGMQKVRNGLTVDAEMQPPPAPPEMPLVRILQERAAK